MSVSYIGITGSKTACKKLLFYPGYPRLVHLFFIRCTIRAGNNSPDKRGTEVLPVMLCTTFRPPGKARLSALT